MQMWSCHSLAYNSSNPHMASLVTQWVKNLSAMQETQEPRVWSLGWKDPLEGENGNSLQSSCLGIPMDRGAWWAAVHGVAELDTTDRLSLQISILLRYSPRFAVQFALHYDLVPAYILSLTGQLLSVQRDELAIFSCLDSRIVYSEVALSPHLLPFTYPTPTCLWIFFRE